MTWRTLLLKHDETVTLPWIGQREITTTNRHWQYAGNPIHSHGWYNFKVTGSRHVQDPTPTTEVPTLRHHITGYLIGNRIVPDGARCDPDPKTITSFAETVYLIEEGLDRFARVRAGRLHPDGPLFFINQEMPLGSEEEVLQAYLDQLTSVAHVKDVTPALDAAFRMETFQRAEVIRRRAELEAARVLEEARIAREVRRAELVTKLGDGAGRREMALHDFATAARAALAVGGAEYLDHRLIRRGEWAVKYRLNGARYECTCDERLSILDAGVCLTSHEDGEKGDRYFTLESLPAVVMQAIRERVLVVYRHV